MITTSDLIVFVCAVWFFLGFLYYITLDALDQLVNKFRKMKK